ncbi:MAG: MFS transporter [Gammaproteobacteria bacterium]|nr:MFS transporter [Gammaproteobacteria bacterium]
MTDDKPILYLAIAQTLVWAGFYYLFPALLLRWETELGWSKGELTGAVTLAIFISALFAPIAGRIIDVGKGALMMASCSLLGAICLIWLSVVTGKVEFFIIWAILGIIMAGCLYEPCFALITRAKQEQAKQSIIFVSLVAGFASTICYPAIHSLSESFGWRIAVQLFAAVVILIATPLMWMGARAIEHRGQISPAVHNELVSQQRSFLKRPAFWFLATAFMLLAVVHGVTIHHMFPILADRGISADSAVIAASFIGPMQVAGRLAMMAAERRISVNGITASCFVFVTMAIILLMGTTQVSTLLIGFVVLFGSAHGIISIVRPVVARDILGGKNFGTRFGAMALFYLAGSASAPYLGSLIWSSGGYDLVLITLIALALIALALYLVAYRISTDNTPSDD